MLQPLDEYLIPVGKTVFGKPLVNTYDKEAKDVSKMHHTKDGTVLVHDGTEFDFIGLTMQCMPISKRMLIPAKTSTGKYALVMTNDLQTWYQYTFPDAKLPLTVTWDNKVMSGKEQVATLGKAFAS